MCKEMNNIKSIKETEIYHNKIRYRQNTYGVFLSMKGKLKCAHFLFIFRFNRIVPSQKLLMSN